MKILADFPTPGLHKESSNRREILPDFPTPGLSDFRTFRLPDYFAAIMLISTFTFFGSPFTATVSLAGNAPVKYLL